MAVLRLQVRGMRLVHYPSPDRYIVMSFGPGGCGLVAKAPAARREEVKA